MDWWDERRPAHLYLARTVRATLDPVEPAKSRVVENRVAGDFAFGGARDVVVAHGELLLFARAVGAKAGGEEGLGAFVARLRVFPDAVEAGRRLIDQGLPWVTE